MTDYTKNTNFTAKDSLASGNPSKIVLGAELDGEFDEIVTCIASKLDTPSTASAKASIALPSASGFHATPAANQTGIVTATPTGVTFGTETYDYGGEFAASAFTPSATGIYLLTACIVTATSMTDGTSSQAWFDAGGTPLSGDKVITGATGGQLLNICWLGQLTSGVAHTVKFQHNLGSNVTLSTGGSNGVAHFSGVRLA